MGKIHCSIHYIRYDTLDVSNKEKWIALIKQYTEWYIISSRLMTKEHYISFVAYLSGSSAMIFRRYPEWDISINMPLFRGGRLIWYCSKCGLLYQELGDNG